MYVNICKPLDSASHTVDTILVFDTIYHHAVRQIKTMFSKSYHEIFTSIIVDHILSYKKHLK